jgi:uncharacterized membrane protein YbaN (DUF454 family)
MNSIAQLIGWMFIIVIGTIGAIASLLFCSGFLCDYIFRRTRSQVAFMQWYRKEYMKRKDGDDASK